VDPHAERYPSWSPYHYVHNNPLIHIDPDGRDAILIVFPAYRVETGTRYGRQPLGHAGVLLIDQNSGVTRYYEYVRYDTDDGTRGRVRNINVSKVVIDSETGKPTQESLNKVLGEISKTSGQKGGIAGAYIDGDFTKMNNYALQKLKESNTEFEEYNKNRSPYRLLTNNCATFACDVIKQDDSARKKAPWIFNTAPINVALEYRKIFPRVNYNPKTDTTTSDIFE
jgi:hypothetical protein